MQKKDFPNIIELIPFDLVDGDANFLDKYFDEETFDCLHHSNVLEHLNDPYDAMSRWIKLIKKGGYMIGLIPEYNLYENLHWPSIFNTDHKHSFSIFEEWPNHPDHIKMIDLIEWLEKKYPFNLIKLEKIDSRYNYGLNRNIDQTLPPDNAEAFIEIVLQKI